MSRPAEDDNRIENTLENKGKEEFQDLINESEKTRKLTAEIKQLKKDKASAEKQAKEFQETLEQLQEQTISDKILIEKERRDQDELNKRQESRKTEEKEKELEEMAAKLELQVSEVRRLQESDRDKEQTIEEETQFQRAHFQHKVQDECAKERNVERLLPNNLRGVEFQVDEYNEDYADAMSPQSDDGANNSGWGKSLDAELQSADCDDDVGAMSPRNHEGTKKKEYEKSPVKKQQAHKANEMEDEKSYWEEIKLTPMHASDAKTTQDSDATGGKKGREPARSSSFLYGRLLAWVLCVMLWAIGLAMTIVASLSFRENEKTKRLWLEANGLTRAYMLAEAPAGHVD